MRATLPLSFNERRIIRAWLVALAGLQWLLGLTWLQFIPSYHHTTASHPLDTWRLPSMLYIIFTPRTILVSTLHCRLWILFTLLSTSRTRLTLKLILMQSRLLPHINLLSHPTAMHVRALKLVWLSMMVHWLQHEWRHHLSSGWAYCMDWCLSGAYISQFVQSWNLCGKRGLKIVDGDPSSCRWHSKEWIWYRWHGRGFSSL